MADKPTQIGGWSRGVDNRSAETDLKKGSVRAAQNVLFDRDGNPRRRKGFTKKLSANEMHSLWSKHGLTFCVSEDKLLRINTDTWDNEIVHVGFGTAPASFAVAGNSIYYTNGVNRGRFNLVNGVKSTNWGPPDPGGQPQLSVTSGGLLPGKYMVAVTFVDDLGAESGTGPAATIELTAQGGIALSNIPAVVDDDTDKVRIYCSKQNGRELYMAGQFRVNELPASLSITQPPSGRELKTINLEQLPAGDIIRAYRGRLYSAKDKLVAFSEPMNYNLYAEDYNYLPQFSAPITMMEPVEDGLYVAADKVYFFRGNSPEDMQVSIVSDEPVIKGSSLTIDGTIVSNDLPTQVAYWFSESGPTLGLPGGQIRQLATDTFAGVKQAASAASIVLRDEGVDRVLTALADSAPRSTFGASDVATIEVIKSTSQ